MKQFQILLLTCVAFGSIAPAQTEAQSQGKADCAVGSACKMSITQTNINGVLNEEAFTGASIAARVNAAVTACGSTVCHIVIPPYAPLGVGWTLPLPNNVTIIDQRGINSLGFASSQAPNLRSVIQYMTYRGADQRFEEDETGSGVFTMDLESSSASGGHTGDGGKANAGALLLYAERTGGSRPIWGTDINVQCRNLNNFCNGLEIDMVNQGAGKDAGGTMNGELIIASGGVGNTVGAGLVIQGSGSEWKFGETIQSYTAVGLQLLPTAGRNADVLVIPPADDTNLEFIGRNHANTANVWSIDDSGNFSGKSVNIGAGGKVVSWKTGTSDPSGTCQTGSLFSNTVGDSGHVFWVCVASAWVDIK